MTLFWEIWPAIRLTLSLAFVTTLILVVIGTPLAWWLARSKSRWTIIVNALIALPLVLPPTVLGFYMLILLGTAGPGGWLAPLWGGRSLAFTFPGLVISIRCPSSSSRCATALPPSAPARSKRLTPSASTFERPLLWSSCPLPAPVISPRPCSAFPTRWANSAW